MYNNTTTVNISFKSDLLREIDRLSNGESRSCSDFIREAARFYIERKNRWRSLMKLGQEIAVSRNSTPDDVEFEIMAHRQSKAR